MANQPSVPIKKPDGSIVKLSMPEFLEYKKTGKLPEATKQPVEAPTNAEVALPAPNVPFDSAASNTTQEISQKKVTAVEPAPTYDFFADDVDDGVGIKKEEVSDDLVIATTTALSTTSPVKEVFVDQAKAAGVEWSKDDHKSPIEEELTEDDVLNKEDTKKLPDTHDEMVDPVLKRAKLLLDDALHARLRSLIISRIKEVRNDKKVKVYATTPVEQGGLGLDQSQAETLLKAIRDEMHLQPSIGSQIIPTKKPDLAKPLLVKQKKTRSYTPSPTPLTGNKKPILHDIRPAKGKEVPYRQVGGGFETMGPIDEIAKFSQVDLQRLGSEKLRVIDIMKNKFEVLKEESFLLFLDAVKAWLYSPLFLEYQKLIVTALNSKQTINQVIQQGETNLTMNDVDIIIEINKIAH